MQPLRSLIAVPLLAERRSAFADWLAAVAARPSVKQIVLIVELSLFVVAVECFEIGGPGFLKISLLALAGFVVERALARRFRLPFFVALSLVGIAWVLGWQPAAWLIAMGLAVLGICHLPISFPARIACLLAGTAVLAAMRVEALPVPWNVALWPVLGSMFVLRTILYLYDLRHEGRSWSPAYALAYFFVLPNVCWPLFPLIDFKTFRRTHDRGEEEWVAQVGLRWMARGLVQLILYRAVYSYATIAPSEVTTIADLARFVVTSFALYLRVSGIFHVAAGMLHLFGFDLPETHHQYFLSSGVNDFWRRINIYWKDFMLKLFFYPAYFRLRRAGATTALVVATLYVVVMTWFLHACQWFWIEGSFPLRVQDAVFWAILAALMTLGTLREMQGSRRRAGSSAESRLAGVVGRALRVFATFTGMAILWSLWTSDSLGEWQSVWSILGEGWAPERGLPWMGPAAVGVAVVLLALSSLVLERADTPALSRAAAGGELPVRPFWAHAGASAAILTVLAVLGSQAAAAHLGPAVAGFAASLRSQGLNAVDVARLQRGYYEDLLNVDRFNSTLWEITAGRPGDWVPLERTAAVRPVADYRLYDLQPFSSLRFKGAMMHTNGWGMRDREYTRAKPAGTYRIALLGGSHSMASGVADADTFESVLEECLNRVLTPVTGLRYEILNFAVGGYGPMQRLLALELKAMAFDPDAILYVAHADDFAFEVRALALAGKRGIDPPFPFAQEILKSAAVRPGMEPAEITRHLRSHARELETETYARIVEDCRHHEMLAFWAMLPSLRNTPVAPAAGSPPAGMIELRVGDVFAGRDNRELQIAEWDHHPNALAHHLIAERLYAELLRRGGAGVLRPHATQLAEHLQLSGEPSGETK